MDSSPSSVRSEFLITQVKTSKHTKHMQISHVARKLLTIGYGSKVTAQCDGLPLRDRPHPSMWSLDSKNKHFNDLLLPRKCFSCKKHSISSHVRGRKSPNFFWEQCSIQRIACRAAGLLNLVKTDVKYTSGMFTVRDAGYLRKDLAILRVTYADSWDASSI